jgi:hypothetical protein
MTDVLVDMAKGNRKSLEKNEGIETICAEVDNRPSAAAICRIENGAACKKSSKPVIARIRLTLSSNSTQRRRCVFNCKSIKTLAPGPRGLKPRR